MATRTVERTTLLPGSVEPAWEAVMSPEIAPIIDPAVRVWRPDREPTDDGTRYTWRIELDGPGPLAAIAARLFRPAIERQQRTLVAYLHRST